MKQLISIVGLSAALLSSTGVQAQWQGNFLLGVSGGWAWQHTHIEGDITPIAPLFVTDFEDEERRNHGGVFGVLAGYQARCNGWLVGGELNFDWYRNHHDTDFTVVDANTLETFDFSTNQRREDTIGLTARLGYEIGTFFVPYIRAGVETNRHRLHITGQDDEVNPDFFVDIEGGRRGYNFVGGVGAEIAVPSFNSVSFRVEYDYHARGRNIEADGFVTDVNEVAVVPAIAIDAHVKPHTQTLMGQLVWNFA